MRIAPRTVEGSTRRPCCHISASFLAASRRAARRAAGMSGRQSAALPGPATTRAASLGQIDVENEQPDRSDTLREPLHQRCSIGCLQHLEAASEAASELRAAVAHLDPATRAGHQDRRRQTGQATAKVAAWPAL